MNQRFVTGLCIGLLLSLFPPTAIASTMNGANYNIDQQSVQIQPFQREQPKPNEIIEKPYAQGDNYTVETTNPESFSFSSQTQNISFGTLQATNPVLRTLSLLLDSPHGYQILTIEDHPLRKAAGAIIPDTTCDNGSCTALTEALWVSALTYGFGYHLDSLQPAYFKPFPNSLRTENLSPLTAGIQATNREIRVTYKANISAAQEAGSYSNTVTYIATPDF